MIVGIELENFKSYGGKHFVGPLTNYTIIVGPNGTGKSNIMDAISFALGEHPKDLRSNKSEDLICHHPENGANSCSVTLFLKLEGKEMKLRRTAAIGKHSEYAVEGQRISVDEYQKILRELGIHMKTRNYRVLQGQIDSERTMLMEQQCGSIAYKDEYDSLAEKMVEKTQHMKYVLLRKRDLAREQKLMMTEKTNLERIDEMNEKLKLKRKQHALSHLLFLEKLETKTVEREAEIQDSISIVSKNGVELDCQITHNRNALARVATQNGDLLAEVDKQQELFIAHNKSHQQQTQTISRLHSELELMTRRSEEWSATRQQVLDNVKRFESSLEEVEISRKLAQNELHQLEQASLVANEQQRLEFDQLTQQAQSRVSNENSELDKLAAESDRISADMSLEMRKKDKCTKRLNDAKQRFIELIDRISKIEDNQKKHLELVDKIKSGIASGTKKEKLLKNEKRKLEEQFKTIQAKIQNEKVYASERERLGEKERILNALKEATNTHGRLIDFVNCSKESYRIPLMKTLEGNLSAILIDTVDDAQKCLDYLKTARLPRMVVIDEIRPRLEKDYSKDLVGTHGKMLRDCVSIDDKRVESAVKAIVNDTIVVEIDSEARRLAWDRLDCKHPVVSEEGTLYRKDGTISAGKEQLAKTIEHWDRTKNESMLAKNREIYEKITAIESEINAISEQFTEVKLSSSEFRLNEINSELMRAKTHLEETQDVIEKNQRDIENIGTRIESVEKRLKTNRQAIERTTEKIREIEHDVFADFCQKYSIANIDGFKKIQLHEKNVIDRKIAELVAQHHRIYKLLEMEKARLTKLNMLLMENKDLKCLEAKLAKAKESDAETKMRMDEIEEKIRGIKSVIDVNHINMEKVRLDILSLEEERIGVSDELDSLKSNIRILRNFLGRYQSERHCCLENCKRESIAIPLILGDLESVETLETQIDPDTIDTGEMQKLFSREKQLKFDYGQVLSDEFLEMIDEVVKGVNVMTDFASDEAYLPFVAKLNQVQDEIDEVLKFFKTAKRLTSLKAIEERLQELQNEADYIDQEFVISKNDHDETKMNFERIKDLRLEKFKAIYEHMCNRVDVYYRSLNQALYTKAQLYPSNFEEPFNGGMDYSCIPPGKCCIPIERLSGGEKTLASITFVFALRSFVQSPFILMDEIDANLDKDNAAKLARFLKSQVEENGLQCILVTLQPSILSSATSLIGVCPDPDPSQRTILLSLDLTKFSDEDDMSSETTPTNYADTSSENLYVAESSSLQSIHDESASNSQQYE